MRVVVSDAVNGGGVVQWLFWDFAGKEIALPRLKKIIRASGLWNGIGKRCSEEGIDLREYFECGIRYLLKIAPHQRHQSNRPRFSHYGL